MASSEVEVRESFGEVERARLANLEEVVERGLASFVEVGNALTAIHQERLYRDTHDTFEDYCRERWQFSASRARQLMSGAETATMVAVSSERQARELAPIAHDPEAMTRVLEAASAEGKPTAKKIREEVARETGKPAPEPRPSADPVVCFTPEETKQILANLTLGGWKSSAALVEARMKETK